MCAGGWSPGALVTPIISTRPWSTLGMYDNLKYLQVGPPPSRRRKRSELGKTSFNASDHLLKVCKFSEQNFVYRNLKSINCYAIKMLTLDRLANWGWCFPRRPPRTWGSRRSRPRCTGTWRSPSTCSRPRSSPLAHGEFSSEIFF